ncbi:MAG: marine proteobacterial sortase target protein, partial [Planctomycetia bacterium]|nr:marine proteobacterial sortase target protein [Planctomycetia bacterium]
MLPLPETAAVYAMTMRVGERVIRAVVQEKQQARKTFEKARSEGRKAALTEQFRANLFYQQVANIGPGEQIMVEIKLLQQADYDQGSFSLRFPMTLTPRFVPDRPQSEFVITPGRYGWAAPTDQVSEAHLLSPDMQAANGRVINPVEISAKLNVGMELREIASAYHQIRVMRHDAEYDIGLVDGPVAGQVVA